MPDKKERRNSEDAKKKKILKGVPTLEERVSRMETIIAEDKSLSFLIGEYMKANERIMYMAGQITVFNNFMNEEGILERFEEWQKEKLAEAEKDAESEMAAIIKKAREDRFKVDDDEIEKADEKFRDAGEILHEVEKSKKPE